MNNCRPRLSSTVGQRAAIVELACERQRPAAAARGTSRSRPAFRRSRPRREAPAPASGSARRCAISGRIVSSRSRACEASSRASQNGHSAAAQSQAGGRVAALQRPSVRPPSKLARSRSSRANQACWSGPTSCGRRLLDQLDVVLRVPSTDRLRLVARLELLARVLADGLQHSQARLAIRLLLLPDQALVDQRRDDVQPIVHTEPAHGLGRVHAAAADEDRQPAQQRPARRRRAGRSSTRWPAAASAGAAASRAPDPPATASADSRPGSAWSAPGRRRKSARGGNSLMRAAASSIASGSPSSRAQISATAAASASPRTKSGATAWARSMNNRPAGEAATGRRAFDPSSDGQLQRRDGQLVLPAQVQRRAAGRHDLQTGTGREQAADHVRRRRGPARSCPGSAAATRSLQKLLDDLDRDAAVDVAQAQSARDGIDDQSRVGDWRQIDEADAVFELVGD